MRAADPPESGGTNRAVRGGEDRMVEHIECFATKLKACVFEYLESLDEGHVPLALEWTPHVWVASHIAKWLGHIIRRRTWAADRVAVGSGSAQLIETAKNATRR